MGPALSTDRLLAISSIGGELEKEFECNANVPEQTFIVGRR